MTIERASDNPFPSILIVEGTEPTAPAAGQQRLYIDSTTHLLKLTNSSGVDTTVGGSSGLTFSGANVYRVTTAQTVANGAAIQWNAEVFDTDTYHDNTTNNSRLTVPATGRYRIDCVVRPDTSTAATRWDLYKNGSLIKLGITFVTNALGTQSGTPFGIVAATAADYFEIVNGSGGSRDIGADGGTARDSWFCIERVS